MQENVLELSNKKSDKVLYIVVDTNVFLSNLPVIEEARDTIFKTFGRPFIVVPWTVIQVSLKLNVKISFCVKVLLK